MTIDGNAFATWLRSNPDTPILAGGAAGASGADAAAASPGAEGELAGLVRALAGQAAAADARAAALAARLAQLETARDAAMAKGAAADGVVEAKEEDAAEDEADGWPQAQGVPETAGEGEALAVRVARVERRLDDGDDADLPRDDGVYELPESTFSLLITHHTLSLPFAFAVASVVFPVLFLALTLASSIDTTGNGNPLRIPAGVSAWARMAQFIGGLIGVLMEDEIPQGLQLIANGAGHTLLLNGDKEVQRRVVISSAFRLLVGALFLTNLFITIASSSNVLGIFYDILALEFVENIDDISFALAKRGFFGMAMLKATNEDHNLEIADMDRGLQGSTASVADRMLSFRGVLVSNSWVNYIVRAVYLLNVVIVLAGLAYITHAQQQGKYRCNSVNALFEEVIWEDAHVIFRDGRKEDRLLMYSYFNGLYLESGTHDGYPKYIEQNKNDGGTFDSVTPAELQYCKELDAWVFMHPEIFTSPNGEGNECNWLLRSSGTADYDILSTSSTPWQAWNGEVVPLALVLMTCNEECSQDSGCNYHGTCEYGACTCDSTHTGDACEFEIPCPFLATEKSLSFDLDENGMKWEQENPIKSTGHMVYNRPVYIQEGLSGQPYDMRLYRIREEKASSSPSSQPSLPPSLLPPTGEYESPEIKEDIFPTSTPIRLHTQKEYDTAPDFSEWDDFFESPALHGGLEEVLEDYKVVVSYIGSRFYGTIIESNLSLDDVFNPDYHAFWSESYDVNRTFIISDTTSKSSPVDVDFFEMRRRVDNMQNEVQFTYGPFGALIPLMEYEGTGFFHCIDDKPST